MQDHTKILIVDQNSMRASVIQEALREEGHVAVSRLSDTANLLTRIVALDPDVIIIDLESPNRDVLEQMFQVSRFVRRPVAMFVDQSDRDAMRDAMMAGVSTYVVDGLKKERVKHILEMCIMRFSVFSQLQDELEEAKSALADRKIIDRAKGILMTQKNLNEQDAYALMRGTAMNQKRRLIDIARAIVKAEKSQ